MLLITNVCLNFIDKVGKKLGELYVDIHKFYGRKREEAIGSILIFLHSSVSIQYAGAPGVKTSTDSRCFLSFISELNGL